MKELGHEEAGQEEQEYDGFWDAYLAALDEGCYRESDLVKKLSLFEKPKEVKEGIFRRRAVYVYATHVTPAELSSYFNDLIEYMRRERGAK